MYNLVLTSHHPLPPPLSSISNYTGGWCKHLDRKNRVKSSIIAPQNIGCIYRAFGRFMKDHVPKCMHIPTDLRLLDAKKTGIVRGSKEYWISSAKDIGLRDGVNGDGIIYCPPVGTPLSIPNLGGR